MAESAEDKLSRVKQMAGGSPTWDLSPNDIAALEHVLKMLGYMSGALSMTGGETVEAVLDRVGKAVDK